MLSLHPIGLLLVIMIGFLSGLIIWGFWQVLQRKFSQTLAGDNGDTLQMWLFTLAVFALGVFVTFVLFILVPGGT